LRIRLADTAIAGRSDVKVFGVDCKIHTDADEIRSGLVKQLATPVYWAPTMRTVIAAGATRIFECGPGKVLTALNRRIDKNRDLKMLALEDPPAFDEALGLGGS
jgi:[acyl-carrier-protein] S-malonyltransferase